MNAVLIIGRVLFALICLNAGINHFTHGKAMVGYAQFKKVPAAAIADRLAAAATPGAILCLHDGRVLQPHPDITNTLDAVALLLPRLKQQNLSITSVSAMLER